METKRGDKLAEKDFAKSKQMSISSQLGNSLHPWLQRIYKHRCVLFVLLAAFCSALQSVLVRFVNQEVHAIQVSFVRSFLQFSIPVPVMTHRNISAKLESKKALSLILLRSVFGIISIICFYYSFYHMRVGDATTITVGSPVFVGVLARFFLKEAFRISDMILVLVAISGIFLISQPPFVFGNDDEGNKYDTLYIGVIFASCTCLCDAFTNVTMRKIGLIGVNSFKVVFYYALISSVVTAILTTTLGVWTMPACGVARFALVGVGASSCASQCLLTYSLSVKKSVFVAILRTNEVLFAFILEYIIFQDFPGVLSLIGGFLVVSASLLTSLKKAWTQKLTNCNYTRSIDREHHEQSVARMEDTNDYEN